MATSSKPPNTRAVFEEALKYIRSAIESYDRDVRSARVDLVHLERYMDEKSKEYTPLNPADPVGRTRSHSASSQFRAIDATQHLDAGKAAVKKIEAASRKSGRPPARGK